MQIIIKHKISILQKNPVYLLPYIVSSLASSVLYLSLGVAIMSVPPHAVEGFYYFLSGFFYALSAEIMSKYQQLVRINRCLL